MKVILIDNPICGAGAGRAGARRARESPARAYRPRRRSIIRAPLRVSFPATCANWVAITYEQIHWRRSMGDKSRELTDGTDTR
ncbi:hypothetical protein EVAR_36855_1 [Eumeta japonica]|uniref:Uncharacterized protein n=1 Tax=Eumeta variegata TaxID=151549 RepID=A0A4C1WTQ4_EUMVA|nr:hypothetical protein EVAR_36855_1 [Eumeta japonica]